MQGYSPTLGHFNGPAFDAEALQLRVEGDWTLLRELIIILEKESPEMLMQIEVTLSKGDARGLEKAAHKIKGALLQFSAQGAVATALKLEALGKSGTIAGADKLLHTLRQEIDLLLQSLHAMVRRMAGGTV